MPHPVVIRTATTEDAAALSALIQRSVRISNAADYDVATIDAICRNFTSALVLEKMAQRDVFVADIAGIPYGTVSLGGGKLHSLFVDPQRQRTGIGRLLTVHLEEHARARGMVELHLSSSLTAKPFYERLGYRTLQFEPRPDGSTWLMVKTLA
jgi:GNAT superfamily N-acetyltransferase